jgi:hypothetical protein
MGRKRNADAAFLSRNRTQSQKKHADTACGAALPRRPVYASASLPWRSRRKTRLKRGWSDTAAAVLSGHGAGPSREERVPARARPEPYLAGTQ